MRWTIRTWDTLTRAELYAVVKLRQDVFVVEQACAYADLDGLDPDALHLLGHAKDGLVAYLRAFAPDGDGADAVIGRVIVAASHRGTGLGRTLMERGAALCAERWGRVPIALGAQVRQRGFYESLGYAVCGPGYDEDGIPHVPMRRQIDGSGRWQ